MGRFLTINGAKAVSREIFIVSLFTSRVTTASVFTSLLVCSSGYAMDFRYSGFASIVAGKTFGSCTEATSLSNHYSAACTHFVADWAHGGVYDPSLSFKPDSKAGVQATVLFNDALSLTAQGVGRLVPATKASLEWAFLTYEVNSSWTLHAGRERLPLFYYSASQDVGYAYPWVRLPPDIYGWDAVNYNGGSATYRSTIGDWTLKANVFAGRERTNDSGYARLFYTEAKDIEWSNIFGGVAEARKDWLTARLVYIQSGYRQLDNQTGELDAQPSGDTTGKQKIYGISANIDTDTWLVRSEYSLFDRNNFAYKAKAWMLGAGVRLGSFIPMITASGYAETTRFPHDYAPLSWKTQSLSVRYELTSSSAFKMQYDRLRDGPNAMTGNAHLISASYDVVF